MAVLKQIKFGSSSTPIAKSVVAINANSTNALSVVATNDKLTDNADPTYTIALAVDGQTITMPSGGLKTALALKFENAAGEGASATPARIVLADKNGESGYNVLSSVDVAEIVGSGIVKNTAYDSTTGKLTITWTDDSTTVIDLAELFDIDDIIIAQDSDDFLSFDVADPAVETGQASLGVKLADVTYTATAGSTKADLTANTTNGKMLDASDAIPAIKSYVDDVLNNATANLEVTAQGDDYITAAQDDEDNKKINVSADVQALTADAGTRGTWAVSDPGDGTAATKAITGETAASISGVAQSLADSSDIATKVATYVGGAVAAEAARADAEVERAIKSLDVADTAASGKFVTAVSETDGKIAVSRANLTDAVLVDYAANSKNTGAIAATDTLEQALNKIENTLAATTVKYRVVDTTLIVANVTEDNSLTL